MPISPLLAVRIATFGVSALAAAIANRIVSHEIERWHHQRKDVQELEARLAAYGK